MNRIIMDSNIFSTRTALVLDGVLTELSYEGNSGESLTGGIYCGRVDRVLPGIKAAFVDIGEERTAYLRYEDDGEGGFSGKELKAGDSVLVQVQKAPTGSKGALLTRKLSFTGKFSVLIPNDKTVGISKKIVSEPERKRIFDIVKEMLPDGFGIIVRTMGEGRTPEDFGTEIERLCGLSASVLGKAQYVKPPFRLMAAPSPAVLAARDIFSENIDEFIVNSTQDYKELLSIADSTETQKIKLYEKSIPIFEDYFIESQAEKAFDKKVWLKSGGFLVIEETEALAVIDVNTGKYTGTKDIEKTFLKTNIEAAKEAAAQIRLRNLSGIIIIDFIDMKSEESRTLVKKTLEDETSKDRIKTVVVGMTELNLMQLTRKRIKPSLSRQAGKPCAFCRGGGTGYSREYVLGDIYRKVCSLFGNSIYNKAEVYINEAFFEDAGQKAEDIISCFKKAFEGREVDFIPVRHVKPGQYNIKGVKKQSPNSQNA